MSASPADDVCAWLDALLTKDKSAGLAPDTLDRLAAIYTSDRRTYMRLKAVMKTHGCLRDVDTAVRRRAHEAAGNVVNLAPDEDPDTRVYSVLLDAPVSPEAVVPYGWVLRAPTDTGMPALLRVEQRKVEGGVQRFERGVCTDSIVITGWMSNTSADRKMIEVSWCSLNGKWHHRVVEREAICDTNKIIAALAPHGFRVNSSNRRDIVDYLAAYEARNKPFIPVRDVSEQMGWQPDGGFLLGDVAIGTETSFQGADAGEKAFALALHPEGTLDGWRRTIAIAAEFPKVELALYASLAAPLLQLLNAPSFGLDWCGKSSKGKTTTLRLAASVWGDPSILVVSWESTDVGSERLAATMSGLPIFVDESSLAPKTRGNKSIAPDLIMRWVNGSGKLRGSKGGMQVLRHWRTIVCSTGEGPVTGLTTQAGVVARLLTLWGSPFNGEDARVPDLCLSIADNYGLAGPAFVRWLVANRGKSMADWKQRLKELTKIYVVRVRAAGGGAVTRIASYLAVLELCAELAHPLLKLPWDYRSPVSLLADEIAERSKAIDKGLEALQIVYARAAAEQNRFDGRCDERYPPDRYAGKWKPGKTWEHLYLTDEFVRTALEQAGHDYKSRVEEWFENGWIDKGEGKHRMRKVRIGGAPSRAWAIRREAVEQVALGGGPDEDELPL